MNLTSLSYSGGSVNAKTSPISLTWVLPQILGERAAPRPQNGFAIIRCKTLSLPVNCCLVSIDMKVATLHKAIFFEENNNFFYVESSSKN